MRKPGAQRMMACEGAHPQAVASLSFYPRSSKATARISKETLVGRSEANSQSKTCNGNGKVTQKAEQNRQQNNKNKHEIRAFSLSHEGSNQANYTANPQIPLFRSTLFPCNVEEEKRWTPRRGQCVECVRFPHVCVVSLQVFSFPPASQRCAREGHWCVSIVPVCVSVGVRECALRWDGVLSRVGSCLVP